MLLNPTQTFIFFSGKGGVGKTTLANATGLGLARQGKKVLVVSTDPAHNLGHLWNTKVGDRAVEVVPGLSVLEIDPDTTAREHVHSVRHTMQRMMPEHLHKEVKKYLDLSLSSPGMQEAAILERIAVLVETVSQDGTYDHVIFDTAPSGHTARLMELPELMSAWTDGLLARRSQSEKLSQAARGLETKLMGSKDPVDRRNAEIKALLERRKERFRFLGRTLKDPAATVFHLVLTAEKTPILETKELYSQLQQLGIPLGALVINRRSPTDQGQLLATKHAQETRALEQLAGIDLEQLEIPLQDEINNAETLAALVECLE